MSAAVITSFLAVVMLLIAAIVIFSVWRDHQRHRYSLASHSRLPSHPLDRHVTAILHLQEGQIVSVEKPINQISAPSPWYQHRRSLVSVGVLVLFILLLFVQTGLAGGTMTTFSQGIGLSLFNTNADNRGYQPARHVAPIVTTASTLLLRVDSADPNQYRNTYQLQTWSYSSCSGIALEMVMNSYGRQLIASDILQKELELGVWDVNLGLLREDGIAMTANYYGFNASAGRTRTLQQVIDAANSGSPVIVSVRDSYYFPGGHFFVIRGGDSQNVYIADSAPTNFQQMSRAMFTGMWQTYSAVLTPRG
ncbi:C39 family peptidase [Ktedonospora formicarum]|uniref:Peptidase C39-like domain-containing protein n=1 Tax=Ktedonospora formicarum TaxID=2778364 RepID=A0A8J3HXK3_9CHLR|nr:C39 family peptidase [Ktedonospora formicarum]GHO42930.1 hypothetical protein KSX_10930 [Ktedonospora formicarum]